MKKYNLEFPTLLLLAKCLFCIIEKYCNNKLFCKIYLIWNKIKNGRSSCKHRQKTRDILTVKILGNSSKYRSEKQLLVGFARTPLEGLQRPTRTTQLYFLPTLLGSGGWMVAYRHSNSIRVFAPVGDYM